MSLPPLDRRTFLLGTAAGVGSLALSGVAGAQSGSPNERVVIGVMGVSRNERGGDGRGSELARQLGSLSGVHVAYVCDVDERNIGKAIESVSTTQNQSPKGVGDFRRILDDQGVDALVVATPDHWHAPAALLGLAAEKHVYVEKPCCHNPHEGEMLVAKQAATGRVVQHGTQRRSWPGIQEAIAKLHDGVIGKPRVAECWYYRKRPGIGQGKQVAVPDWLNWSLWQGPAPEQAFRDNIVHYNWHWFWHWGTGEAGNNGIHMIDVARWGLGVTTPNRVTSAGVNSRVDDQQTPDANMIVAEFDDAMLLWRCKSWGPRPERDPAFDVVFRGDKGTLGIQGGSYKIFDEGGKEIDSGSGNGGDLDHLGNFVAAIRGEAPANAPITEGYASTLICHLGNIAYRTTGAVSMDSAQGKLAADSAGHDLWQREYRDGWEPKV